MFKKLTTKTTHRIIAESIISSGNETLPAVLSTLTPNTVKLILSDPYITTHTCLSLFHVIFQYQTLIPFQIQTEHYATLICRAIHSRRFEYAKTLITSLPNNQILTFPDLVSVIESNRFHSKIVSKLFNLMFKVYSNTRKFDAALETFDYMRSNGIRINDKACFGYLIAVMRSEELGLGLGFLYRMMECGVHVSVYCLTVVVDGLCKIGDIRSARELVEEAMGKDVKPNVVTFNTLIDACCRRWKFDELDLVLVLMEKGGVGFNLESYRFLILGLLSGGRVGDAERMVREMDDKGLKVEVYLWNSVIVKYCKLGKMESAFQVFDEMTERSVVPYAETYRIMVSGICGIGEMEAAKELADKLVRKGIDLGSDVFDDLVNGCCKKGEFDDAVGLLSTMERKGLFGDVRLYILVIVGLCESNRVEEASRLLSVVVKCGATTESFMNLIRYPK